MSRLVIMEGWINQKTKTKEICEVYVVLTKSHLKVYKSQINYKQRPNDTLRVLELSENYNILPMSFDNEYTFSIFKKGEKASERLYLHATSKADYEFWLNQIEGVLNPKNRENDINSSNGENLVNEKRVSAEPSEKSPIIKATYNIKNSQNSVIQPDKSEIKNLQEKCLKLEGEMQKNQLFIEKCIEENDKLRKELECSIIDMTKLKELHAKLTIENETLKKTLSQTEVKLQKSNDDVRRIKLEKQHIVDKKMGTDKELETLKKSLSSKIEKEENQMSQILTDLSSTICSTNVDLSSYIFCVDFLTEKYKSSVTIESLFKQQLVNLIHRCPIDLNGNITILDYLTVRIDLSQDCAIDFICKLLLILSNFMKKSSTPVSRPDTNLISIVRSVVTMTKSPQKDDLKLNFHQTSMEIAYLLIKKTNTNPQFTNGISDDVTKKVDSQYEEFLRMYKFDTTKKLILTELGEQMKERFQTQLENKENLMKPKLAEQSDSMIRKCIDRKWSEMLKCLEDKNQEINDLTIVVRELSERVLVLESSDNSNSQFLYDEFLNVYSMNSEILCSTCQFRAVELLEMPIIEKMNKIVSDFKSYWKSILNIHLSLNLKQKSIFGIRDIFEKMTQSTEEFESVMKQFSEITSRKIENPLNQKSSAVINDQ